MRPKVIIIVGPTASGKSALAERLALTRNGEIISADSAQVYIGMNCGTAKPDVVTRKKIPHHLIDIIPPTTVYNAQQFAIDATQCAHDILERGGLPIIAGGTMLYIRALLHGFDTLPQADAALRETIARRAAELGWPAMHAELAQVDVESAARLKPNDKQRIGRALEVFQLTGKSLSEHWREGDNHRAGLLDLPYELYALMPSEQAPRAELHERIAKRFHIMVESGLVDEVRALRAQYGDALNADSPSMRCVGYRQAWEYIEGNCSHVEFIERGVAATRQLAKRQMTWIRGMTFTNAAELEVSLGTAKT